MTWLSWRQPHVTSEFRILKYLIHSIRYILDISSQINYYGLKSLAWIICGDFKKAFETTLEVLSKLRKLSPPTAFFTLPGFCAIPEVILLMIQWHEKSNVKKFGVWEKPEPVKKLNSLFTKAMLCLRKFSEIFPFAEAHYHLYQAMFYLIDRKVPIVIINKLQLPTTTT